MPAVVSETSEEKSAEIEIVELIKGTGLILKGIYSGAVQLKVENADTSSPKVPLTDAQRETVMEVRKIVHKYNLEGFMFVKQ